jgi:hypothetical protein
MQHAEERPNGEKHHNDKCDGSDASVEALEGCAALGEGRSEGEDTPR